MQEYFKQGLLFLQGLKKHLGTLTMLKTNSVEKGLPEGWTRATFVLRKDHLDKLKAVSYWERKKIKEVMDEALGSYLKSKKVKSIG